MIPSIVTHEGQRHLALTFIRPTGSDAPLGISTTVRAGDTLDGGWPAATVHHATAPIPGTAFEAVTYRMADPLSGSGFMRLEVNPSP